MASSPMQSPARTAPPAFGNGLRPSRDLDSRPISSVQCLLKNLHRLAVASCLLLFVLGCAGTRGMGTPAAQAEASSFRLDDFARSHLSASELKIRRLDDGMLVAQFVAELILLGEE